MRWPVERLLLAIFAILTVSCTKTTISGPITMQVFAPVAGQHCRYEVQPRLLETVTNVKHLRGHIGTVVTQNSNLLENDDIRNANYDRLRTQFSKTGKSYYPLDLGSLWAGSFYYALEVGYRLYRDIAPGIADMRVVVPQAGHSLESTLIFQEARIESGDDILVDNAGYVSFDQSTNIFLNAPTVDIKEIPLVFNLGVMVHEYSHLVSRYLYRDRFERAGLDDDSTATGRAIAAMDEGIADYFGFLATRDPGFILCSLPTRSYRDLSDVQYFGSNARRAITNGTGFEEHVLGSFFATAQYYMGELLGDHNRHALSVIQLMQKLGNNGCGSNLTYSSIASCHQTVAASHSRIREVYQELGFFGGN